MKVVCPSTFADLLTQARDPHDQAAWAAFNERYGDFMLRFLLTRGVPLVDAQDLRQDVLIDLWRAMPEFRLDPTRGRFRGYLVTALCRVSSRTKRKGLVVAEPQIAVESRDEIAVWVQREWQSHRIRSAMRRVRSRTRSETFELFRASVEGETSANIAARTGMKPAAVRKAVQRVRDEVRLELERFDRECGEV